MSNNEASEAEARIQPRKRWVTQAREQGPLSPTETLFKIGKSLTGGK